MVLRPNLNMYCNCSNSSAGGGKCQRPSICAEKVCATTLDADFVNTFVLDADEIAAKKFSAEEISVNVPAGAASPTLQVVQPASPGASAASLVGLPVFGVPFGGFTSMPGSSHVGAGVPVIVGSNTIGTVSFSTSIAAGTVLVFTYGAAGFPAEQTPIVAFLTQQLDLNQEGYTLPMAPSVIASSQTGFSVLFPDSIQSSASRFAYTVTTITHA
jgi:hypothetical protein